MDNRFIETAEFPAWEVNEKSLKEKGPGKPPFWEMVFYWMRKPLIGARAVIAASLLPVRWTLVLEPSICGVVFSTSV